MLFLEHPTDLCHSNIVEKPMPSTFQKVNCLPIYRKLSAEELGKDFQLIYYLFQNAHFNTPCKGSFVHCGSEN